MVIPKVTHQVWFQGWNNLPEKYQEDTEKLSIMNQNWEHKKWDEQSLRAECEKFSSDALTKFDGFTNMIQKVDFGRYVVLHNYGGVSVDCDTECLRPLEKTPGIDRYDIILCKNSLTKLENKVASFGLSKDLVVMNNATICCAKEHPLMKQFIEFLIKNESWNDDLMFDTQLKTGPLVMSIFFNKYLDDVLILDSDVFEPFGNINRRTILNHKYDQSWTGFGALPINIYKFIKNNLIWILLIVVIIIKFLFFRRVLENSLG
jgi:mannosyltransferase OCH1-like enzyme